MTPESYAFPEEMIRSISGEPFDPPVAADEQKDNRDYNIDYDILFGHQADEKG